jgi:hypothetical protein
MMKEGKMSFIRVASTRDVEPGVMKAVTADSTEILLVNLGGSYFAIGNVCRHMGCRLSMGTLSGVSLPVPVMDPSTMSKQEQLSGVPRLNPNPPMKSGLKMTRSLSGSEPGSTQGAVILPVGFRTAGLVFFGEMYIALLIVVGVVTT